ncbi:TPA: hypothetical protein ENS27_04400 [bacterium]|nr:hypothetical protein [bacterium]
MKTLYFSLLFIILLLFGIGCSDDVERENPLDAKNMRTGGIIPGVTARAGDSQVTLSWLSMGLDGIKEYKIYRAYKTPENFEYVASVPSGDLDSYAYTDTGLLNDGDNVYFYRITYIDINGQETPDPINPQNLPINWSVLNVIPSLAPPVPNVRVMEDRDLQVRLIWEGYIQNAPSDLAGYKVYIAPKAEEGQEQKSLQLVSIIDDPRVEFYIDGNDYPSNKINFTKDGISKLYKVVAFDQAGVESDSPILVGTSPNLPPSPPSQFKGRFSLGLNSYEVRLEWQRSLEPDVIGYKMYALLPDGTTEFKGWKYDPNDRVAIISDRYIIVDGVTMVKQYYVTAYDNTPRPDGKNDESEPSALVP